MADHKLSDQDHANRIGEATSALNAAIKSAAKAGIEVEVNTRALSVVGSAKETLVECQPCKVLHSQN